MQSNAAMVSNKLNSKSGSKDGRSSFVSWHRIFAHAFLAAVVPFVFGTFVAQRQPFKPHDTNSTHKLQNNKPAHWGFPLPKLHKHKTPPVATYSGLCLDDPHSNEESTKAIWSQHRVDVHLHIDEDHQHFQGNTEQAKTETDEEEETLGEGFDGYQPAGQHMLIDIQNVDPSFLLDMERLAKAMVQTTTQSGLTLLSYHCHDLQEPMGVSCLGVLLESHVSIHTWPNAGILSLDLFTCGPASLLPLVPLLESLFAIPSEEPNAPKPFVRWVYKKRGYRDYTNLMNTGEEDSASAAVVSSSNPEAVEMEQFLVGWNGYHKNMVVNAETDFQEVTIFEMSHSHMPLNREAHSAANTNKKLYLDNVAQSSVHGLEAYHEALVHPALLAHTNPKRVAIIGGGEGATLREVLKHNTVETCTMLEIDGGLVDLSREYLQEWNDCSDFASSPGDNGYFSCYDDPRAQVLTVDAYEWFVNRFGTNATIEEEPYDVIIMDALDPSSRVDFSDVLYGGDDFVGALANGLTGSGILIAQVGISSVFDDDVLDPAAAIMRKFSKLLQGFGAKAETSYSEAHGQFLSSWDFHVVFMDPETKTRWHSAAPGVDSELAKRAIATKSGSSPFNYFDGASQQTYQFPGRIEENFFCSMVGGCLDWRGSDAGLGNARVGDGLRMSPLSLQIMKDMSVNAKTRKLWGGIGKYLESSAACYDGGALGLEFCTQETAKPQLKSEALTDTSVKTTGNYNPFMDRNAMAHAALNRLLSDAKAKQ